jgi:hypothetical protein
MGGKGKIMCFSPMYTLKMQGEQQAIFYLQFDGEEIEVALTNAKIRASGVSCPKSPPNLYRAGMTEKKKMSIIEITATSTYSFGKPQKRRVFLLDFIIFLLVEIRASDDGRIAHLYF